MRNSTTPAKRILRIPEQWQALVDQFEHSDLSQRAFCQRNRPDIWRFLVAKGLIKGSSAGEDCGDDAFNASSAPSNSRWECAVSNSNTGESRDE